MSLLGSILGSDSSLVGSFSDGYGHCCPPVFDPYTLVALLGGIALATFFLQRVIVGTTFGRSFSDFNFLSKLFKQISAFVTHGTCLQSIN